jgi:FkbM family methyltransferase
VRAQLHQASTMGQGKIISALSVAAQKLFQAMLRIPDDGASNRVMLKVLGKCRNALINTADPLVQYEIQGKEIVLPLSHELPFFVRAYPHYSVNIARIAAHAVKKYPDLTVIDIGANIGDTLAMLRGTVECPVLCIEGDERFFDILRTNATLFGEGVYLEKAFVGSSTEGTATRVESGRGTTRLTSDHAHQSTVRLQKLSDILQSRPLFTQPKFVKVDTDGFDIQILKGEIEFLEYAKPVLFFEYDPYFFEMHGDDGLSFFNELRGAGYSGAIFYENNGDYLLTAELANRSLLEDIHNFYSGRGGQRYCDVCTFHEEDSDLCRAVRLAEIEFFDRHRDNAVY